MYRNHYPYIKKVLEYISREDLIKMIIEMDEIYVFINSIGPVPTIKAAKVKVKLWNAFSGRCNEKERLQIFYDILKKDKLVLLSIKKQKFKLQIGTVGYIEEVSIINALIEEIRVFLLVILACINKTDKLTILKIICLIVAFLSVI